MLNLTFEYKIQPTKQQVIEFETWLERCCQVYNYALAERKDWINSRKSRIDACSLQKEYIIPPDTPYPSYVVQCASLTKAKVKESESKVSAIASTTANA